VTWLKTFDGYESVQNHYDLTQGGRGRVSVFTRFDVPMFTWRDGLQRQAVEWKRRPVMLRGGVCA
jgi:hypothetical protein